MSNELRRYQELEDDLVAVRWRHAGFDSEEEDRLLEEMDGLWWRLSTTERDALQARPPRSLLRPLAPRPGLRALFEAQVTEGSHDAPRQLREVG